MKLLLALAFVLLIAAAGAAAWIRLAGDDPATWHKDPMEGARTGKPNDRLIGPMPGADAPAPVWAATPEALMQAADAAFRAMPRTMLLAGDVAAGHATYVQRSATMAFPDYISVRAVAAEGGATLAIWSRSRYGHSDLGVNAKRLDAWIAAIDLSLAE